MSSFTACETKYIEIGENGKIRQIHLRIYEYGKKVME